MYNIACSFQVKRMIVQKIKMVATGSFSRITFNQQH